MSTPKIARFIDDENESNKRKIERSAATSPSTIEAITSFSGTGIKEKSLAIGSSRGGTGRKSASPSVDTNVGDSWNGIRKRKRGNEISSCDQTSRGTTDRDDYASIMVPKKRLRRPEADKFHSDGTLMSANSMSTRKKSQQTTFGIIERLSGVSSEQMEGFALQVSFEPLLLAKIDQREILESCEKGGAVGCVLSLSVKRPCSPEIIEKYTCLDFLKDLIRRKLVGEGPSYTKAEAMKRSIYDLICDSSDTMETILPSCQAFIEGKSNSKEAQLAGEDDLGWWGSRHLEIRKLAFLRRLLLPMCVKVKFKSQNILKRLESSFADILLQLDVVGLQAIVIDALILRTCQLKLKEFSSKQKKLQIEIQATLHRAMTSNLFDFRAFHESTNHLLAHDPDKRHLLKNSLLGSIELRNNTNASDEASALNVKANQAAKLWEQYLCNDSKFSLSLFERRSCPPNIRCVQIAIWTERQLLLKEYAAKQEGNVERNSNSLRLPSMKIIPNARDENGDFVLNGDEISAKSFSKMTRFMKKVNATFLRPFYANRSRPRLQQLKLPKFTFQQLKALFFDFDGSLRNSIRKDIDTSLKHGYINFSNKSCVDERNDERWQVPLKHHMSSANVIGTRETVERLLGGVFNPAFETLDDIGMLIGGTEDQSLHHDVARQMVHWIPEVNEGESTGYRAEGWEVDRLEYNEAMASPNAPMSLVIGMGDQREVLLGVQKDQIEGLPGGRCKILNGNGEEYDIVRENDNLVVIRSYMGCMFTGDFPHAGVRNVALNSPEDKLLQKLNLRISAVSEEFHDDRLAQTRAVIDVLCSFPGLNKLCRLHCSTKILGGNLQIPENTIGFTGCEPNPPDPRCLQDDEMFDNALNSYNSLPDLLGVKAPPEMAGYSSDRSQVGWSPPDKKQHVVPRDNSDVPVEMSKAATNGSDGVYENHGQITKHEFQALLKTGIASHVTLASEMIRIPRKLSSTEVTPHSSPEHDRNNC